jgi:hypothetical protein
VSDGAPAAPGGDRRRKAGRSPGIVFAAFAAVLVVLVASAFTPQQPPPPPTAEFAPEAAKPIKAPPPNQTSAVGDQGTTGTRGGTNGVKTVRRTPPGTSPSSTGPTVDVPSVKNCVGDPPRQTEDPQSPPCVPYFKGDNGGATSTGVDKDTIRVAFTDVENDDVLNALIAFVNKRFEFYGRKIVRVSGSCPEGSPASLQAHADTIAQKKVFAVAGCSDVKGAAYPFYDELARKHVVSVANRTDLETEAHMAQFHPYEWNYFPTYDRAQQLIGDIACKLKGKPATHSGPVYQRSTRKYGLIFNTFSDQNNPDLRAIQAALAGCGISYESGHIALEHSSASQGYSQNTEQQATTVLTQFQNDGVTSVIDLVHATTLQQIAQVSSSIGYQPEHIISSYLYSSDSELGVSAQPQDQSSHMFGETVYNPHINPQEEYWYSAVQEGNPSFRWTDPTTYKVNATLYYAAWYNYYSLLMLAAGIQTAGPHLTPESFAKGLQTTTFPNPIVAGHPEGKVSIQPGQHSYIADQSLEWFVPGQPDPSYGNSGSFCYAELGKRYAVGQVPAKDPFQSTPCRRYGS